MSAKTPGVNAWPKLAAALLAVSLCGCATYPAWLPSSGPSREQVRDASTDPHVKGIEVIDVNYAVASRLLSAQKRRLFSETLGAPVKPGYLIGQGDVVEVTIWEAPPATLFGGSALALESGITTTRSTTLPPQMVDSQGTISVPFAGNMTVSGKSPQQVEKEIEKRLGGKANQPQVLVRIMQNNSENVTVIGEVAVNVRMPLTSRGERLLDALAAAGGVKQPVNKIMLQLTREGRVYSMPLDTIIRDPEQNIPLQTGDVLTAIHQPFSFTVLGATGKNEEINFEAQGISLAQALARVGGLQDSRADARGVFIFRFESADAIDWPAKPEVLQDGRVPAIYVVDLRDPANFFVTQTFPIKDKDMIYVSNAPAAELQKFLNIVGSITSPVLSMGGNVNSLAR